MIIDSTTYGGACVCGRSHDMVTKAAIIEAGCLHNFEAYMAQYAITGKRCALYGGNGYKATADRHPKAEQEIVLDPTDLHANEIATAEVLAKMDEDVEVLIAIGSGTIHDIARYCAHARGIRFVSCPTGASVDGFCSTVAAMTWYGYKNTMTAVAPEIVIADTEIIAAAPAELVRSGVGDIMAKYTALMEWQVSHRVTGEYLCPRIYQITKEAADMVMTSVPGILAGDVEAYGNVAYALIMSGIAMQMMGNSRPASGAEHHISHMIEMGPAALPVEFSAMHGEKTGVGTVLAVREYYRMAEIEDITPYLKDYAPLNRDEIYPFFGDDLIDGVMDENKKDCLAGVTPSALAEAWADIRQIIRALPTAEYLYGLLGELGAKKDLEDIGVSSDYLPQILNYSPMVRNRLTLMRMRRMMNL